MDTQSAALTGTPLPEKSADKSTGMDPQPAALTKIALREKPAVPKSSDDSSAGMDAESMALNRTPLPEEPPVPERSDDGSTGMDIQSAALTRTLLPEKPAVLEERNGEIQYRVVNNDNTRENLIILTGFKCLVMKEISAMPKAYVTRIIYDYSHTSIAIVKMPLEVIGGMTWREFKDRGFAEIVFCVISSKHQTKGYGAHLMAHLKDYVKANSPVMNFLTYADNSAIRFFAKQGFTTKITLDKTVWKGYIKDYDYATMMQCTMLPRVRYLEAGPMLAKQKEAVQAKIRASNDKSDFVHPPPKQWADGDITPIDPCSIPAIKESGWSEGMDELARVPRYGPHYRHIHFFLSRLRKHRQAWPFLKPVDKEDVPDYYDVITKPMDLQTMGEKLKKGLYLTPEVFVEDIKLIVSNCKKYNGETLPYAKCAVDIEKYMWTLIKRVPEWLHLVP